MPFPPLICLRLWNKEGSQHTLVSFGWSDTSCGCFSVNTQKCASYFFAGRMPAVRIAAILAALNIYRKSPSIGLNPLIALKSGALGAYMYFKWSAKWTYDIRSVKTNISA